MKKITLVTTIFSAFFCVSVFAVEITSFGSASANGTWEFDPASGSFSGSSDSGDALFESFSPVDITGLTTLQLLLEPTTVTSGTSFTFELYESLGGAQVVASAIFNSSQLLSGVAESTLISEGSGSFSNVGGFIMTSGGTAGDSFNVTLNSLQAVPEPSTYALIAGIFALGYIMIRRSRSKA